MTCDGDSSFVGNARFEVIRRLGVGGMGEVYEVLDRERDARVALKKLKTPSPEALLRFKHEFRALDDIEHPNLVMLGELIEDSGQWFFTMELVEGVDFLDYVRPGTPRDGGGSSADATLELEVDTESGAPMVLPRRLPTAQRPDARFDERRLRSALAQLASAVAALHAAGKVHRDIKPTNIIVTDQGRLALLDLGLVADVERDTMPQRMIGTVAGTAAYMAPEQAASGVVGAEADWYAVGVLLFQALTGQLPFDGAPLDVMAAKQERVAPAPSRIVRGVPADLDLLCTDLLKMSPDERPIGAEVLRRLRAPAEGSHPSVTTPAPFVGRRSELDLLHEHLVRLEHGEALAVLVEGESGVGKSALVQQFVDQLSYAHGYEDRQPPLVLAGRCHERESVPYKAFDGIVDSLSRYLVGWPRAKTEAVLPRSTGLLAQAFPVLRRIEAVAAARVVGPEPMEERERRDRVFTALRDMFGRLGERGPLVLIIDDLQWADADSMSLLNELLRPPGAPALLLIATVRTPDKGDASEIQLPGYVERMLLTSLSAAEAHQLAKMIVEELAADSDVNQIAMEAEGHPLFIGELARYAAAHPGQSIARVDLETALWSRIRQLDPQVRRMLAVVAVAGTPLHHDVAARAGEAQGFTEYMRWVSQLRSAHLVRTTGMRTTDTVEPYHDRVRAAVLIHVASEVRRICHRRIAIALEGASSEPDPEALAVHWGGAGENETASRHALEAAHRAAAALAFDRAARLYRAAIDLGKLTGARRAEWMKLLADAQTNAGRGADAARAYLEAAEGAHALDALELRERAAAEYLRSGHIAEGMTTLDLVLEPIGMKLARTPRRALMSLLWNRAKARLRGMRFRERDERTIPKDRLIRIDACWSVATGLALVDTIRGADFQARQLLLALRLGEPFRVGRALAAEAGFRAMGGTHARTECDDLLGRAQELADAVGDPRGIGFVRLTRGIVHYLCGEWVACRAPLREAEAIFRERTIGMGWELFNSQYFRLLSYFWTGELAEFKRMVDEVVVWADERGDLLASTTLRNGLAALCPIVDDEPERARENSRRVVERLPQEFQFQHYWQMLALASADLYDDRPDDALAQLDKRWKEGARAMLYRIQYIAAEAYWLRGRVSVAAAGAAAGERRDRLLLRAEEDARRLERQRAFYSRPMATAIRAGVANLRGDAARADALLVNAVEGFSAAEMLGFAACVRLQRGRLIGGTEGQALVGDAHEWLRWQRAAVPDRLAALFCPGFR